MEVSMTGSQVPKLGKFKGTTKKGKRRSLSGRLMDTRGVMQLLHQHEHPHQRQKLPRSRTKNNKTSMWDTMVVT